MPRERPVPGLTIDDLLAHREWVGRVARTLVHGDAEAEDLEQRAWVRVLEHPPAEAPRSPRGWLRTVLRFAAIDGMRERATRRRHEMAAAARESAGAAPDDLVARAEILERLVHAVLELEEPYRGTILLRYFEDLPPREIARKQGVPVETVRTRLKRALEKLRKGLGGDRGRERLMLALAPLLRPEGNAVAAVTAGGIVMGTAAKIGLAAGVAILATGGVVAWRASQGGVEVPSRPVPVEVPVAPGPAVPPTPRQAEVPGLPAPARIPAAPALREEPAPKPTLDERLAEVIPVVWNGITVGAVVQEMAHRLDLEPEYESRELELLCFSRPISASMGRGLKVREALTFALRSVPSSVEGKVTSWEVRKDRLFVLVKEPPPPPRETDEAAKEREKQEKALLERLRTEKTAFAFDGQTLPEAFNYLSARHGMNFVVEDASKSVADAVIVKLTLKDVLLTEALDELVRLDPDLLWEVRGSVVLLRKR
jgi:RNA polymerase sigma-70 factor (ECF subfamily)